MMNFSKKVLSLTLVAVAIFCFGFVFAMPNIAKADDSGGSVISDFTYDDSEILDAQNLTESYTNWKGVNLSEVIGGAYYYPDIMSTSYQENVDGATGGKALKVGFIGYNYTPAIGFGVKFKKTVRYDNLGKLVLRVFMHIDNTGKSEIRIYSLNGESFVSFTTERSDEWVDIEILNDDIQKVCNNGEFNGFNIYIKFAGVRNGNYQDQYSDYWGREFKADPSYMYFDKISYVPYSTTHTVTYDYNKEISGIDNQSVSVRSGQVAKPENPSALGYEFIGWYTEKSGGDLFDFSSKVNSDITLFARYKKVALKGSYLTDFTSNSTKLGYAKIATESYIEWLNYPMADKMGSGPEYFPLSGTEFVTELEGAEDGCALKVNFMGFQFTTAVGFSVSFPEFSNANEIGKIVIRTYMHIDTDGCSVIKVYNENGDAHFDFTTEKSDRWVDVEIKGNDLKKVLVGDKISSLKFVIVFGEVRNGLYKDLYSDYWKQDFTADPSYMYIDSITYKGLNDVTINVDGNVKTVKTIDGDPLTLDEIPYKEGYMFAGWLKDGEFFDANSPITEPVSLTAVFEKEMSDYSGVYGVYVNGDSRIIFNKDKSAFIINEDGYKEFVYNVSESGTAVLNNNGELVFVQSEADGFTYKGLTYQKGSETVVKYKYLDKEREVFVNKGDKAINIKLNVPYYVFKGWKSENSDEKYDFSNAITDGLILVADLSMDEIENYDEYLGSYYYENGDSLIILGKDNKGELIVGGKTESIVYHLFNGNVGVYEVNGKQYEFDYNASSIKNEVGRHRKLKRYTVSFVNGEERVNVEVDGGNYKIDKSRIPENPTKEGYEFMGWYLSGEDEPFNFEKVINNSITLEARWKNNAETPSDSSNNSNSSGQKKGGCFGSVVGVSVLSVLMLAVASWLICGKGCNKKRN